MDAHTSSSPTNECLKIVDTNSSETISEQSNQTNTTDSNNNNEQVGLEQVQNIYEENSNRASTSKADQTSSPAINIMCIENLNEIKLNYTKRLIPIFCKLYLNCMIQSINKSCLNLLRKLINFASKEQLDEIVQSSIELDHSTTSSINHTSSSSSTITLSTLLVELISKILQENQNYESIFIGLSISNDLFRKCSQVIVEEFTRLGVGHLITQLAIDTSKQLNEEEAIEESSSSTNK